MSKVVRKAELNIYSQKCFFDFSFSIKLSFIKNTTLLIMLMEDP